MKAAIIPNYDKSGVLEILDSLKTKLDLLKIEYCVSEEDCDIKSSDFIITIGGDGTIIHAAKKGAELGKPIIGIHNGRVGYLADITPKELDLFEKIASGDYIVEERMMLSVSVGNENYYCLNDAVITKGSLSRMIDINVEVDGNLISYRADGLIAATPTGSTAYSMAAGGPIVDPALGLFVLTPICSNSLFDRPVLFNDNSVIRVSVSCPKNTDAFLTVDGEKSIEIKSDDVVVIKRADVSAKLMRVHNASFYKTLFEKMRG
ncbi:MAG: NAD(+)/NADH kinase [Acutalibacteraceae bacterium]|nr:NAD(+)/NADH kinase [Acutalibacteraceae bacterium]